MSTPSSSSSPSPNEPSSSEPSPPLPSPPLPSPIEDTLSQAAQGLAFMSETDAPLAPFFWPGEFEAVTAEIVARQARLPADAKIEQRTVAEFFEPVAAEEEWQNEDERVVARRFQALVATLEQSLREATVFRVGEVAVDVYIVGLAQGGLAGLRTRVVET